MGSGVTENENTEDTSAADESTNLGLDGLTAEASLTAKEAERKKIQAEIEAYLTKGGKITRVESNVMKDPPKAPESNYGGQPI